MLPPIAQNLGNLRALCAKHRVKSLSLFESAATGAFQPGQSDLDFLVEFEAQPRRGFEDVYFLLADDLERLFGCAVDLVERQVIERSSNPYRRESIYSSVVSLYAA